MLHGIENAKESIFIETFRFENDPIGIKFRNLLTKKAREGVKILLLLDAWGTAVNGRFFIDFIEAGGEVKFFKKLRFVFNFLSANHERNHRKLLLIDKQISYISSINISNYNLNWREFTLRLTGNICIAFKTVFLQNYNLKNTYKFDKKRHSRTIKKENLEIVRDVPSVRFQRIKKKLIFCINKSKQEIFMETPYFLPTYLLTDALIKAANRGVRVTIIIPRRSDVKVVDILRAYYLGKLHDAGIKIMYYLPTNLHSKLMLFDEKIYAGSSNIDYRSFRYMFEIGLFGEESKIYSEMRKHVDETLKECIDFDYDEWKNRKKTYKVLEHVLLPIKHFL
jgi:cardiolipin synthase